MQSQPGPDADLMDPRSPLGLRAADQVIPVSRDAADPPRDFCRPLIRLARQVEVREGAVDMRLGDLLRGADIGFVELVVAGDAEQ